MNAAVLVKWLVSRGVSYTAIALLALALLSLNFASEKLHRDMIEQHAILEHAAANIKYEASRFHLWFEEALATGDAAILDASFRHLDSSEQSARAMLEGRTDQGKKVVQLTDPELRKEIGHVLDKLVVMRTAAKRRQSMPGRAGIGTAADRDFDAVYNHLLGHVEHVESALKQGVARDLAGLGRFYVWMNVLVLLLVAGVGLIVFRSSRRQKADAERILEGESRFRTLMETASDAIISADTETGLIIDANRSAVTLLGKPREEIVGMHQSALHPADEAEHYREIFQRHSDGGDSFTEHDLFVLHADGHHIPVDISASVVEISGKRIIQGIFHDITERKQKEDMLIKYQILFSQSNDLAYMADAAGNISYLNQAFDRLAGHSREEFIGKQFAPLFDAGNLKVAVENYQRTLAGESPSFELQFKDTGVVCEYRNIPHRDNSGKIIGVLGIARDVTERRRIEDALRAEKDFSDSLVETAQVIVLVLNPDGTVRYINPFMEKLSGYRLDEVEGKDWFDTFLPEKDWSGIRALFRQAIGDIRTMGNITPIVARDGSEYRIEWYDKTLKDRDGEVIGLLAIGLDVSERLQAEEKIQASLEEKEVLLREIHHRVKNNLQVISSLLSLQAHAAAGAGQEPGWLRDAQARISAMGTIHEDLCRSGDLAHVDFAAYIRKIVRDLSLVYGAGGRQVSMALEVEDVLLVMDRAIPLGLIVNELVVNSLKYAFPENHAGTITITLQQLDDKAVALTVADDGVGLPKGLDWRNTEGVGLQLVLALVDQLEGEIDLRPAEKGVCFVVTVKQ